MNSKTISGKVVLIFTAFVVVILFSAIFIVSQVRLVDQMESNLVDSGILGWLWLGAYNFIPFRQWLTDISATRAQDGPNAGFDEAEKHAVLLRNRVDDFVDLRPEFSAHLNEIMAAFVPYYATGKRMAQG